MRPWRGQRGGAAAAAAAGVVAGTAATTPCAPAGLMERLLPGARPAAAGSTACIGRHAATCAAAACLPLHVLHSTACPLHPAPWRGCLHRPPPNNHVHTIPCTHCLHHPSPLVTACCSNRHTCNHAHTISCTYASSSTAVTSSRRSLSDRSTTWRQHAAAVQQQQHSSSSTAAAVQQQQQKQQWVHVCGAPAGHPPAELHIAHSMRRCPRACRDMLLERLPAPRRQCQRTLIWSGS